MDKNFVPDIENSCKITTKERQNQQYNDNNIDNHNDVYNDNNNFPASKNQCVSLLIFHF